jgi:carboxymethylenebutenolidase
LHNNLLRRWGIAIACAVAASTARAQTRDSTGNLPADTSEGMARAHAGDSVLASAPSEIVPQISVVGEEVTYGTGDDGEPLRGYLVYPGEGASGSRPAVIAIHDWWGLTDNTRAMARRLAGEGYTVLAVDLYGGRLPANADAAAALMRRVDADPRAAIGNLKAANAFLRYTRGAHRLATIGWSLGGEWSIRSALFDAKHVHAVVVYYGAPDLDRADLTRLRGPLLGFYAGADESIRMDDVRAFKHELDALGKTSTIKIYDGAKHGFANPTSPAYDSTAADDAWRRMTEFLSRSLRG